MSPALIAIDWGSSSFRAYLMSAEGEVLDEVASGDGIGSVAAGAYPPTLKRLIGQWLEAHPSLPVIASGMVGSRHGWREAAYVECPAGPRDVAAHLTEVEADGRRVVLAPGLSYIDEAGQPDVMRGEETEIFGVADSGARLIVLPGSHSKWARVEGDRVVAFKTFITGELFAAVRDHTVAGAFARAAPAKSSGKGVRARSRARRRGRGRRREVRPDRPPVWSAIVAAYGRPRGGRRRRISVRPAHRGGDRRGAAALSRRGAACRGRRGAGEALPYAAFEALGVSARAAPTRAAARGLFRIARDGGLL